MITENILTTANSSASTPFVVVQQEATLPGGSALWKLFSNEDVRPQLGEIFAGLAGGDEEVVVQRWPYTFPRLVPVAVNASGAASYQPIDLEAGGGRLLYINTMESVASAMEGSIIAGRNAALLLAH